MYVYTYGVLLGATVLVSYDKNLILLLSMSGCECHLVDICMRGVEWSACTALPPYSVCVCMCVCVCVFVCGVEWSMRTHTHTT